MRSEMDVVRAGLQRCAFFLIDIQRYDCRSFACKKLRGRLADTPGRAGNHGDFPRELSSSFVHFPLLITCTGSIWFINWISTIKSRFLSRLAVVPDRRLP